MGQLVVVVSMLLVYFIVLYASLLRRSLMLVFCAEGLYSVLLIGVDVFLVIDLFKVSQEGVALLDANYLGDLGVRVDVLCWRLALAILRTGIYHRYF